MYGKKMFAKLKGKAYKTVICPVRMYRRETVALIKWQERQAKGAYRVPTFKLAPTSRHL